MLALSSMLREDSARRQPRAESEEGSPRDPDQAGPLISDFQTPKLSEIGVCCLSHPVCESMVFLLQRSELTHLKVVFLVRSRVRILTSCLSRAYVLNH